MPIYEFECEVCKGIVERILGMDADTPMCCGVPMSRRPTYHAFAKMKGMGGYPSLRKAIKGGEQYYDRQDPKVWV